MVSSPARPLALFLLLLAVSHKVLSEKRAIGSDGKKDANGWFDDWMQEDKQQADTQADRVEGSGDDAFVHADIDVEGSAIGPDDEDAPLYSDYVEGSGDEVSTRTPSVHPTVGWQQPTKGHMQPDVQWHTNPAPTEPPRPTRPTTVEFVTDYVDNRVDYDDYGEESRERSTLPPPPPPRTTERNAVPTENTIYDTGSERRTLDPFLRPGILAAVIGGAMVGLLAAILLVMFIVYRMRKKDEGSYALDEPKAAPPNYSYAYQRAPTKEFYA